MRIEFFNRSQEPRAAASVWREALRICSNGQPSKGFRFHDLRHTCASWFMMNGGDLYKLEKILAHSNIKMTERYAKLGRRHIARTSSIAREIWKLMQVRIAEQATPFEDVRYCFG